jgi:hypothetical protein
MAFDVRIRRAANEWRPRVPAYTRSTGHRYEVAAAAINR